ncbi:cyclin-A1 [Polymixia lowei]
MRQMNVSMNTHISSYTSKENVLASNKMDASHGQRAKQRTVLGVLTENEQHGRSHSQGGRLSKHSSISDSSQIAFVGCPSASSFDAFDEPCEVVLPASGEMMVPESHWLDEDAASLQHRDFRLFLELSSSSCADTSMQSLPDEPQPSQDALCLSEYAEDIHRYLRERELKFRPKRDYMKHHSELTNSMRLILVDWLVEVVQEYKLCSETLHLAVNYLDRFLACTMSVTRGKLQLVGTVAMLLAAKYEEIFPPELGEFVYITDGTYTKKQLIRMEHLFLKVLAFDMTVPTTYQFLRHFVTVQSVCSQTENLALYVAELGLMDVDLFRKYLPSMVAAAAYCLANYTLNRALWPEALREFTGYNMAEIVPCLKDVHKLYFSAESHPQRAIREKYQSSKFASVARITPTTALPFP